MRFFTTVYALLLTYIVAALLFWGLSLQKQSRAIYELERRSLAENTDSVKQRAVYDERLRKLKAKRETRKKQYIGEGATFFVVILIGAGVVYTSFRRSIGLSRQQNNFMLAVTHELKSPIAGIKLSLQTIQKRTLTEEQRQTLIGRCIEESDRLNDLCNNMLITSQMEGRQYVPAHEQLDFSKLVEEGVQAYQARYGERFSLANTHGLTINGDMPLLQMAVNNLLENAVKYTPPASMISVSLQATPTHAVLQVADEGNGIPEEEKKKIFSKFYRIGDELTRNTKGTGLGLYLTARIVKQHKGKLCVRDNKSSGALFELCLPLVS
jgi:signal transduction histidine kinase